MNGRCVHQCVLLRDGKFSPIESSAYHTISSPFRPGRQQRDKFPATSSNITVFCVVTHHQHDEFIRHSRNAPARSYPRQKSHCNARTKNRMCKSATLTQGLHRFHLFPKRITISIFISITCLIPNNKCLLHSIGSID